VYVCICQGVTQARIESAVQAGADSVDAIGRACGAGADCGTCRGELREILRASRAARPESEAA
jgi:bacterioferritin-associated ferredoxin